MYFNKASIKPLHSVTWHQRTSLKCRAENNGTITDEEDGGSISKETLMWRAIKLTTYTVALIPITVGSAVAYWQTGLYYGKRYLMLLVSSVLVVSWLNLRYSSFCLVLLAVEWKSSFYISASCSIIFGYIYQSYVRLGEPLCFAAFGPFATTAIYLLQTGTRNIPISGTLVAPSIHVGLTTALILFCSHFHQIERMTRPSENSLLWLGTEAGAQVVKVIVCALYSILFILGLGQTLPVLCALTLPVGMSLVNFVEENHRDKEKIFMAKYYCVRLHTLFEAALAVGLVAARLFARKQLPHAVLL